MTVCSQVQHTSRLIELYLSFVLQKGKQKSIESFFSKKEKDPEHENRSTKCEDGESFDPNYLPVDISYGINHSDHDSEGRSLILDYPLFTVLNLYVSLGVKIEIN